MKKIFTLVGFAALSFGLNAQSSVLLNETFTDGNPSENLSTTSNYLLKDDVVYLDFTSEENIINLQYTLNPSDFEADSISATYEISAVNLFNNIETADGYLDVNLFNIAPFQIATQKFTFYTILSAEDEIQDFKENESSYTITKGFSAPFSDVLDLIDLDFYVYYAAADNDNNLIAVGYTPEQFASSFCALYYSDETELEQCNTDVISALPEISSSTFVIDNVVVTSHKITGVEGSSTTSATPVKAFNTLGKEVSLDTKNEAIIVIYSDGSSAREYNAK
jgi:hypothetical protein